VALAAADEVADRHTRTHRAAKLAVQGLVNTRGIERRVLEITGVLTVLCGKDVSEDPPA
jgi:hypothetical protein